MFSFICRSTLTDECYSDFNLQFDLTALVLGCLGFFPSVLDAGAASIGKGLGGMLFSRFGRSSTTTPQTLETGKDGTEGDDKKATTVGTPPLPHSSSAFLEPTG